MENDAAFLVDPNDISTNKKELIDSTVTHIDKTGKVTHREYPLSKKKSKNKSNKNNWKYCYVISRKGLKLRKERLWIWKNWKVYCYLLQFLLYL